MMLRTSSMIVCVRYWSSRKRLQALFLLLVAVTLVMVLLTALSTISTHHGQQQPTIRYALSRRYLSCRDCTDGRRIGNLLFNYASLVGIAARNNMTPILPHTFRLVEVFDLPVRVVPAVHVERFLWPFKDYEEYGRRACAYDLKTERLVEAWGYRLVGYYQSWRYFERVASQLRRNHLRFRPEVLSRARNFLARDIPGWLQGMDVVKVGIHVRRGDTLLAKNHRYGYTVADAAYFRKARQYFLHRHSKVVFVVCGEETSWSREHIAGDNVVYSEGHSAAVDLAILSLCDHTIMSVGSFSWWAAWLANGTTIYYEKWPRPTSILEYHVDRRQYFMPHWIPMS